MRARGSAPIELALGVGALIAPVVILLALVPPLFEARALARLGAAEAARVVVLGDGSATSHAEAVAAARVVAGRDATVSLCGGICSLERGAVVEVSVEVVTEPISVPFVGSLPGFGIGATHREQVDAYRSLP